MDSFKEVLAVTAFCLSGSGLTVINKYLLSDYSFYPGILTFIQCVFTAFTLHIARNFVTELGTEIVPITYKNTKQWIILVIYFACLLMTSMYALERVTVTTLIVVRNLTTLTTAFFDFSYLGTRFSGLRISFLIFIFFGACLFGIHDTSYDAIGYIFLLLNCCANTAYQIKVKMLVRNLGLSALSMAYYNNTLSLPVLLAISFISGELTTSSLKKMSLSWSCSLLVLFSSVLGLILSASAFRLNQLISATSLMVINNANKFFIVLYSELFMKNRSLDLVSSLGCGIVLLCTFLYSYFPNEYSFSELKCKSQFCGLFLLRTVVLIVFFSSIMLILFADFGEKYPQIYLLTGKMEVHSQHFQQDEKYVVSIPFNLENLTLRSSSSKIRPSTHQCIGDSSLTRSCLLQNVMYDVETGRLKYLRLNAKLGIGISTLSNSTEPLLTTAPVLNRRSLSMYGLYVDELNLNEHIASSNVHEMKGTNLLFTEYAARNFEHFLVDNLYVAFSILTNLGVNDIVDVQLLLRSFSNRSQYLLYENWSPLFFKKPVILDALSNELKLKHAKLIYFHTLAVGGPYGLSAGAHSVHSRLMKRSPIIDYKKESSYKYVTGKNFNRAEQILRLRRITMKNLDIDPNFIPNSHLIVILNEIGKQAIRNIELLHLHLKKSYPSINVRVINSAKIALREQMLLMSKTTVLVASGRSMSFVGMYQSPGTFSICLESPDSVWKVENQYFWQNLNYLKQIIYPVSRNDIVCDGKLEMDKCDINVDVENMRYFIDQALFEISLQM